MRLLFTALAFCFLFSSCDPTNTEDTSGYNCTPEGCFADMANAQYLTLADCLDVCEEDNSGSGNSSNNGDFFYSISLNGNIYSTSGNIVDECGLTGAWAGFNTDYELGISAAIGDPTSDCYDSGGYISIYHVFNTPFIGPNEDLEFGGSEDFVDYIAPHYNMPYPFNSLLNVYMFNNTTTLNDLGYELGNLDATIGWLETGSLANFYINPKPTFELTSLGTAGIFQDDINGNPYFIGNNVEGSYSGTLYFLDISNLSDPPTLDEIAALANVPFTVPLEIEINFSVTRSN